MKTSYVSNLILVLFIIILFWYSDNLSTPDVQVTTLTNIQAKQINHISIKHENRNDIELQKSTSGWKIIQPLQAEANNTRINLLLSLLSTSPHNQLKPSGPESLTQFGLDPIKLSLHLNDQIFMFGDTDPINNHRYILYNDTIYLINDDATPLLNANAASFINNRLLSSAQAINKLQLSRTNEDGTLSNELLTITQSNGRWQSDSEQSTDKLNLIVDSWQNAYAIQVLPLTESDLNNITGQPVTLWHTDVTTPIDLIVQINDKGLFIINIANKLKYQFPVALKDQLFLNNSASE